MSANRSKCSPTVRKEKVKSDQRVHPSAKLPAIALKGEEHAEREFAINDEHCPNIINAEFKQTEQDAVRCARANAEALQAKADINAVRIGVLPMGVTILFPPEYFDRARREWFQGQSSAGRHPSEFVLP